MTIRNVLERFGRDAYGDDPQTAAEEWAETGMSPAQVEEWLSARCFSPGAAEDMADAGIDPGMARTETDVRSGGYVDTVAFKVANGDLEVEEARDLLGAQ